MVVEYTGSLNSLAASVFRPMKWETVAAASFYAVE